MTNKILLSTTTVAAFLLAAATLAQASGFATYFARVTAAGVVSRSSGVASATRTAVGTYNVLFNREVNYCGWVANITGNAAGYVTINIGANAKTVNVVTRGPNGAKLNLPFSMMVQCAP